MSIVIFSVREYYILYKEKLSENFFIKTIDILRRLDYNGFVNKEKELIMSCLHNERIYEGIYDDVLVEFDKGLLNAEVKWTADVMGLDPADDIDDILVHITNARIEDLPDGPQ